MLEVYIQVAHICGLYLVSAKHKLQQGIMMSPQDSFWAWECKGAAFRALQEHAKVLLILTISVAA